MLVLPAAANAASGTITYAVSTGTGAATYSMTHTRTGNVGSWKIQRGEAALSLGTCSGPYTYTDIGPANPASPFVDTSPPDGVCVKYQLLVTDSITASVATIAGANIVRFDRTDPTVVLTAASPSPWINTTAKTLNLTRTDATVVTSTVAWQNTTTLATGTACASTTTASCSFNVSTLPDGPYLLTVTSTDTVGRVSTGTLSVMYDVTAPVITLAPANELTGAAYQHRVGSTIFYNPSYAGSFVLGLNASDPGTGANTATYVTFGAGWTFTPTTDNTQPYESTYSWSAGASGSGAKIVNVNDFSGRTATFTLTLTTDTLGPTPGTLGWTPSSASVSLTYTGGSDAASGLGDVQVMRDSAPDTGSCGSPVWTGFANVGAVNPSFPYVDTTVVANTCYRYRIRQFDNVGNFANTSTTSVMSNFSSTDTTNPTGTINATPVAPFSGAKTLTGTSADVGSGIASITLSYSGPQSGSVCTVPSPAASSWVCPWNTATLADGTYTLNLHIVDASSNFSDVTRTVVLDNTLPTGTIAATPLGPVRATATLTGTTADAGTGVQHADVTYAGPASGNVCLGTSPSGAPWSCVWDTTTVPDGTYTITSHVTDYAGNAADITRALVVDNTGPVLAFASAVATSGAAYQYASGSTLWVNPLYAGATDITFTATDAASGMGTVTFPALGSGWTTIGGPVVSAAPFRLNHVRTIGSAAPGSVSVTGTDATGNTATSSFTVTNDALAPTGGTVAAAWGTTDVTLTHTLGSDAGSGMGSHQLQRRQAPRVGPACGSYGTWTDVLAANPVSPAHDTTTAPGTCYQYRLAQTDRVGNVFVVYAAGEVITPASGFGVTNAPASVAVTEGGGSAAFTSVLTSAPTANVTITLAAGAQLTTAPAAITFTPANWATPQTITVTAVDDAVAEASPHAASVGFTATSSDTDYAGLSITAVAVAVTDNDAPGLDDLGSSTSVTVAEGGATDTFVYRLGSQPTAPVTVALGSDAQVTTTPATLTFTTANWNVAQTVTVAAVDDFVSEGAHTGAITPTVTSPDPIYTGLLAAPVSASVVDDDTAGVTVTPGASLAVTEGGVNGSFSAQLTSEPTGTVTIAFTPDAQLATSTTAFTFTPANWNVPQVATVDAVDDSIVEASPHAGSIALVAASADAFYGGIAIADVSADISDNDVVGITVAANAFTLAEGGSSTTADVVLASQPTADVTIAVTSPDSQLLVDQSTLTFTALDWNVPQTITIDAVDDAVGEISPHTGTLAFTVTSADAGWSGAPVADVLFAITDDDGPPADLVPPVGGAVNVVEHWVNTPTNPVPFVVGTDAGSGIGTWRLQRRLATLAGGAC
ncbi:MAG: hypothetical protein JWN72_78, partial [Thermoleophilia bacterium]|nr:hypothetical protein [Thermoleophilia bacterium]